MLSGSHNGSGRRFERLDDSFNGNKWTNNVVIKRDDDEEYEFGERGGKSFVPENGIRVRTTVTVTEGVDWQDDLFWEYLLTRRLFYDVDACTDIKNTQYRNPGPLHSVMDPMFLYGTSAHWSQNTTNTSLPCLSQFPFIDVGFPQFQNELKRNADWRWMTDKLTGYTTSLAIAVPCPSRSSVSRPGTTPYIASRLQTMETLIL